MKKDLELPYVKAIEVAAVMKALASHRDDLTPDEAYDISYSLCDLLNVCSASEVISFFNEKVSEVVGDDEAYLFDEPEEKNTKSIQNNGVVNIPSDCTNFIFNNINSKDSINEDLFIFEDPYDDEAFIIVADPLPTFKKDNKKIYPKALNEFFSLGFQNRNQNPALRRLKVMKKTFNGNASKVKFENCWYFDERLHKDIPVIKVVFF